MGIVGVVRAWRSGATVEVAVDDVTMRRRNVGARATGTDDDLAELKGVGYEVLGCGQVALG
jgi:hypothetical protein